MVDKTESEHGRIGVVVNNAGIIDSAMALKMSADQWQRVLDVNLTGAFNVLQAVGPSFVRAVRGGSGPPLRRAHRERRRRSPACAEPWARSTTARPRPA